MMKHNNKYLLVPKRRIKSLTLQQLKNSELKRALVRVRYRKKDLQKRGDGDGSGETPMNALKNNVIYNDVIVVP